jgi:hypothetical protein
VWNRLINLVAAFSVWAATEGGSYSVSNRLVNLVAVLSLLLCLAVVAFWVRSHCNYEYGGYDQVKWTYSRWLSDGGAAGSYVELMSDLRLGISLGSGRVGPFNGQLVWGYHVNADESGGWPRLEFHREPYDALTKIVNKNNRLLSGAWPPIECHYVRRRPPIDGDDSAHLSIGVSHWLVAALLAVLPAWAAWQRRFQFSLAALIAGVAAVCVALAIVAPLWR